MDPNNLITQVSRDQEEQLNTFPPPTGAAKKASKKPRHKGLLNTLLCCFRRGRNTSNTSTTNSLSSHAPSARDTPEDSEDPANKGWRDTGCSYGPHQEPQIMGTSSDGGSVVVNASSADPNIPNDSNSAPSLWEVITTRTSTPKLSLLPPLKPSEQNKICLVIDLDETLVHSSFKPVANADFVVPVEIEGSVHQVYVLKRPYVDEFLEHVGKLYECVLFTASLSKYADPVADLLDKCGVFRGRLFRESCAFYRGNYVKDLNRLGRDVHKVVIIDNSPASYMFHPDNAVPVGSWFDDMNDTELRDLIPFFENMASASDVYSYLRTHNMSQLQSSAGSHDPQSQMSGARTNIAPMSGHIQIQTNSSSISNSTSPITQINSNVLSSSAGGS